MTENDRTQLRSTFGEDAELYDRCRPGYPPQMFYELSAMAGIDAHSRVLEIGCGTGQTTAPLARAGCTITAVELSEDLAAVATRNLAEFEATEIVVAAFEDWPLPPEPFDLVLSATAFHWLDPEIRVTKAADGLRPGGALAIVSTHHVAGGTNSFFVDSQRCYEQFDPGTPPGLRLPAADHVPQDSAELDLSGRFGPVKFRRYQWEQIYTTAEYLDLLSTYSGHRSLPDETRENLLGCIAQLVDSTYGGQIVKAYLTQLAVARRLT